MTAEETTFSPTSGKDSIIISEKDPLRGLIVYTTPAHFAITGANSKGIVVDVDPTMCRIGVDVEKGFVDPILSTGSSSSKSVTPTSIIDMKDGVAYYVKDGIKSTHFVSGATAKTIYEDEFEKNEEKRKIKIIRPNMIGRIVSQFEKVMKS